MMECTIAWDIFLLVARTQGITIRHNTKWKSTHNTMIHVWVYSFTIKRKKGEIDLEGLGHVGVFNNCVLYM